MIISAYQGVASRPNQGEQIFFYVKGFHMGIDCKIDWLTVKFDRTNDNGIMFCENWRPSTEKISPKFRFAIFSGEYWTNTPDNRQDAIDIIKDAIVMRGKITRVDFAIDIEEQLNYRWLYDEMQRANPRKHVHTWISRTGTTVYVGTRTSQRFLRIYDKQGETKHKFDVDVGFPWCRIELEVKRYAVERYIDAWLVNPNDVAYDIITRYGLGNIVQIDYTAANTIDVPRLEVKSDAVRFVMRYRKIIGKAFEESPRAFFECIGARGEKGQ